MRIHIEARVPGQEYRASVNSKAGVEEAMKKLESWVKERGGEADLNVFTQGCHGPDFVVAHAVLRTA